MNNLKALRKAAGMSRAALAEKSGISERTIEKYEQNRNDLKNARAHIVLALAKALGVGPEKMWEENKMFVVRYEVNGESGEWCVKMNDEQEIVQAICDEYGCDESAVKIIKIFEQ